MSAATAVPAPRVIPTVKGISPVTHGEVTRKRSRRTAARTAGESARAKSPAHPLHSRLV